MVELLGQVPTCLWTRLQRGNHWATGAGARRAQIIRSLSAAQNSLARARACGHVYDTPKPMSVRCDASFAGTGQRGPEPVCACVCCLRVMSSH